MAANIDYKAAYKELVNYIRSAKELWSRESHNMQDKAFQAYCEDNFDVMRACEGLQERYNGMADECANILEESDCIVERMTSEQEQLTTNANGRVSLHLIDSYTERCLFDLDCNTDEVPSRLWSEILDTAVGTVSRVSTQSEHIHEVRMNGFFGLPIRNVHLSGERYYWVNDDDKVVSGPEIWEALYRDTALAAS